MSSENQNCGWWTGERSWQADQKRGTGLQVFPFGSSWFTSQSLWFILVHLGLQAIHLGSSGCSHKKKLVLPINAEQMIRAVVTKRWLCFSNINLYRVSQKNCIIRKQIDCQHIPSSLVKIGLHTQNQSPGTPRSGWKAMHGERNKYEVLLDA